jgi:hypothetical protein
MCEKVEAIFYDFSKLVFDFRNESCRRYIDEDEFKSKIEDHPLVKRFEKLSTELASDPNPSLSTLINEEKYAYDGLGERENSALNMMIGLWRIELMNIEMDLPVSQIKEDYEKTIRKTFYYTIWSGLLRKLKNDINVAKEEIIENNAQWIEHKRNVMCELEGIGLAFKCGLCMEVVTSESIKTFPCHKKHFMCLPCASEYFKENSRCHMCRRTLHWDNKTMDFKKAIQQNEQRNSNENSNEENDNFMTVEDVLIRIRNDQESSMS